MQLNNEIKVLSADQLSAVSSSTETLYVNGKGISAHGITQLMTAFVLIVTHPYPCILSLLK